MKKCLFVLLVFIFFVAPFSIQAQIITTFAGNGTQGNSGDGGPASAAELYSPSDLAIDDSGNIYISDQHNGQIRKVNSSGVINTIADFSIFEPSGLAIDRKGNLYICDVGLEVVCKVNTFGIITVIAGTGIGGYSGDGGPATAAELHYPSSIATDEMGNLFIADQQNNRIRKVDTFGIINTIAGNGYGSPYSGGYSGDGGAATDAELNNPTGISVAKWGTLYFADGSNNRIRIIDTTGIINTIAGNGTDGYNGDGGQATSAEICTPVNAFVDNNNGNVYIADVVCNTIRIVSPTGTINTVANIDGLIPSGKLGPTSVVVDTSGNIFIAVPDINRVLGAPYSGLSVNTIHNTTSSINIYPNPNTGSFALQLPQTSNPATITITDILGSTIATRTIENANNQKINFDLHIPPGAYIIKVATEERTWREKMEVW